MLRRRPNSDVPYVHTRADGSGSAVAVQCGRSSARPRLWSAVLPAAPNYPLVTFVVSTVASGPPLDRGVGYLTNSRPSRGRLTGGGRSDRGWTSERRLPGTGSGRPSTPNLPSSSPAGLVASAAVSAGVAQRQNLSTAYRRRVKLKSPDGSPGEAVRRRQVAVGDTPPHFRARDVHPG